MNKNFVHYLVWLIPIRSLRDKARWKLLDNVFSRDFCHWLNYQTYKDKIKNKKTFFVTNEWLIDEKEFFINKAIGWSLRDYSKTNTKWVRDFIKRHKNSMNNLSIREASKYIL